MLQYYSAMTTGIIFMSRTQYFFARSLENRQAPPSQSNLTSTASPSISRKIWHPHHKTASLWSCCSQRDCKLLQASGLHEPVEERRYRSLRQLNPVTGGAGRGCPAHQPSALLEDPNPGSIWSTVS